MISNYNVESEKDSEGKQILFDVFTNRHSDTHPLPCPMHIHTYFEVVLVLYGEMGYQNGLDQPITVREKEIIFTPPGVPHRSFLNKGTVLSSVIVKFSPSFLFPLDMTASDVNFLFHHPSFKESYFLIKPEDGSFAEANSLIRKIMRERADAKGGYELAMRGLMTQLYILLIRNFSMRGHPTEQETAPEPEIVQKNPLHNSIVYMEQNYMYDLTLDQLAQRTNMSYTYFSKMFKKTTGKTFSEYLLDIRLNEAKRRLLTPNVNITEIAIDCGFNYVSHFIQQFRKATGMTPKEFHNRYTINE